MAKGGMRIGAGRPKKGDVNPMAHIPKPPKTPTASLPEAPDTPLPELGTRKSPLDYMLDVMNDPGVDEKLRAQMAVAAAPYMHAKKGEGGKKDELADKAKQAAGGRFKPAAPPLKLVVRK